MTDTKISALPASTTPLVGTEVLPIVQGSTTKQVSIADLTAGRTVSMSSALVGGASAVSGYNIVNTGNIYNGGTPTATSGALINLYDTSANGANTTLGGVAFFSAPGSDYYIGKRTVASTGYLDIGNADTGATYFRVDNTGNMAVSTTAKGINFTANTPAAGMTSQLLNWYEEGTWTPNQGAGLTVVGAFSSTGTYTRIGRQVTIRGQVIGATSVAVSASGVITSNLPYTAAVSHAGSVFNAGVTSGGSIQITSTSVISATTITATPSITFTATYTV